MRRMALALTALLILTSGSMAGSRHHRTWFDDDRLEGSGNLATERRDIDGFTRIHVGCAFDLDIVVGEDFLVELTHDDNLLELMETDVRGRTLTLDCREEHRCDHSCLVRIRMPALEELTIEGAADVEIRDFDGERFAYALHGAGDLTIEGSVGALEVRLNGAGDVDARDLRAEDADVRLAGAGAVRVHATERFRGTVSGVGTITYYGDPQRVSERVTGIGSIRSR